MKRVPSPLLLALAALLFDVACGNANANKEGDASSASDSGALRSDARVEQDGASGDGCSSAMITSAPAQWVRPANCGGVGNLCSQGCGSAECELIGNVCIPPSGVGASASACLPYCLSYACMTFDQASCFCTGDAGATSPSCACGPAAVAGLCAAEGASCATTPCCSCQGLMCVTDSVSGTVCRQPCSKNGDCVTGCCNTTDSVCQDSTYCNCTAPGSDAGSDAGTTCANGGASCCPGTSCLTFTPEAGIGSFACYTNCTKQSDCASGCCSAKIAGQDYGACGPCL
jgi:hypothetical protein